ncbi:peroxiredoxin [Aureococcus anophagefferens]|nr:peroxiredoxin [Aureococcus anophagefferens]
MYAFCVNDAAALAASVPTPPRRGDAAPRAQVMKAWAKDQSITGDGLITFWADNLSVLTKALGMAISHPGPSGDLGPARSKRFVLLVEDGVVKFVQLSEAPDDPRATTTRRAPSRRRRWSKILTLL